MVDTLYINLYGGPGSGKSTTMAYIFSELKWKGINCEMATEYAKDKVWEGSKNVLTNQFYISAKQYHKLFILNNKVDIVITDSPIILGIVYNNDNDNDNDKNFENLIYNYYKTFNNFNVFIKRNKKYEQRGRVHSYNESIIKDNQILKLLHKYCHNDFMTIEYGKEGTQSLINLILSKYNIN